jgi:hypothetical protein
MAINIYHETFALDDDNSTTKTFTNYSGTLRGVIATVEDGNDQYLSDYCTAADTYNRFSVKITPSTKGVTIENVSNTLQGNNCHLLLFFES